MAEEDCKPLFWDLGVSTKQIKWGENIAFTNDKPVNLNDVTPGGIDTIMFSGCGAKFVATRRTTKDAAIIEITLSNAS